MAAAKALSFAAELGLLDAVMEADSMVIIKALEEEHNPLSPIGPLITDAKFNSHFFTHLLYSHTKRECNFIAHGLARLLLTFWIF